jgi:hypothetical protein
MDPTDPDPQHCFPDRILSAKRGFSFIPTDRAPPGSTFKWIDNKKCIFTVEIEAVSSVHTESEHLGEQASFIGYLPIPGLFGFGFVTSQLCSLHNRVQIGCTVKGFLCRIPQCDRCEWGPPTPSPASECGSPPPPPPPRTQVGRPNSDD